MRSAILVLVLVLPTIASAQEGGVAFSIAAEEAPKEKAWEEPAKFAWTSIDGDESFSIDVAAKASAAVIPGTDALGSVFVVINVNDEESNLQERYKAGVSLSYDLSLGPDIGPDGGPAPDTPTLILNPSVAFQRKAVYAEDNLEPCEVDAALVFCDTQYEETLQFVLNMEYSQDWLEKPIVFSGPLARKIPANISDSSPAIAYGIVPALALFHDEVVSDAVDPETGMKTDGGVSGVKLKLTGSVSPRFLDYRVTLRGSIQTIEAFDRDPMRKALFPASAASGSVSLDYNFVSLAFAKEAGWKPAIGITYKKGADPLAGRGDEAQTIVAFKLSYVPNGD